MKNNKRHVGLYITAVILTLIVGLVAFFSYYVMASIDKISNKNVDSTDGTTIPKIDSSKLSIPKEREDEEKFSDKIINIAIFGIDERAPEYDGDWARADSIIVLTVDEKNNKIKLSSVLRDTYVNVVEYGNAKKDKINHSFAFGAGEEYTNSRNALLAYHAGAVRAMETLNGNFKLDIKDYAIINFNSFKNVIDKLGGVDINLTDDEINIINTVYNTADPVSQGAGVKTLNGNQALAYTRDRKNGTDTDRSKRQRIIVEAVFNKIKAINPIELPGVVSQLLTAVKTSLDTKEILSIASQVLMNKMPMENTRFPVDGNWNSQMIDGVSYDVIVNEGLNLNQIRDFIYNDVMPGESAVTTTAPQQ